MQDRFVQVVAKSKRRAPTEQQLLNDARYRLRDAEMTHYKLLKVLTSSQLCEFCSAVFIWEPTKTKTEKKTRLYRAHSKFVTSTSDGLAQNRHAPRACARADARRTRRQRLQRDCGAVPRQRWSVATAEHAHISVHVETSLLCAYNRSDRLAISADERGIVRFVGLGDW